MNANPSPTVIRRILVQELRRLRRDARQTQREVAAALGWSIAKPIRLENGTQVPARTDLKALLGQYRAAGTPAAQRLLDLLAYAKQKGWPDVYRGKVSDGLVEWAGLEAGATRIRVVQIPLVPWLLQTEEYARDLIHGLVDPGDQRGYTVLLELTLGRSASVRARSTPLHQSYVLEESALRRRIGGRDNPTLMGRQLRHLIDCARQPHIDIRVLPFTQGTAIHHSVHNGFTLLDFDGVLDTQHVVEHSGGAHLAEDQELFERNLDIYTRLVEEFTLAPEASIDFIAAIAEAEYGPDLDAPPPPATATSMSPRPAPAPPRTPATAMSPLPRRPTGGSARPPTTQT